MNADEEAIRTVIATWHRATAAGDASTVLTLMAEDVVFLVAGRPPIRGRKAFAALQASAGDQFLIASDYDIEEIIVHGDWAHCWTRLSVTMTPVQGGPPVRRSGHTLSIFRKEAAGAWVLARDANMLTKEN
jgi:uncharacterized protein (TIGR02246 family)